MSWRSIFAILILALAGSAWGGLRLGEWLVAHGPAQVKIADHMGDTAAVPVLDANGKPYAAQPPQPLPDGRLGYQEPPAEIDWQIAAKSLDETKSNQVVAVATTPITMVEAQRIAASNNQKLVGIADVGNLMAGVEQRSAPQAPTHTPIQPIEAPGGTEPAPAPAANPAPIANRGASNAWQARLRQDLQACSAESFFDRPSCAWAARNKYCTPNNAWGTAPDCPAKSF